MPVGIVQVFNKTSRMLHYRNLESNYKIDLNPRTQQNIDDGWIPCSNYHDDTVPYRSSSHIEIWFDSQEKKMHISDDNWMLYILVPDDKSYNYGPLQNGDKYTLRFHEVQSEGGDAQIEMWIWQYDETHVLEASYHARSGAAMSESTQQPDMGVAPVATLTMAV